MVEYTHTTCGTAWALLTDEKTGKVREATDAELAVIGQAYVRHLVDSMKEFGRGT